VSKCPGSRLCERTLGKGLCEKTKCSRKGERNPDTGLYKGVLVKGSMKDLGRRTVGKAPADMPNCVKGLYERTLAMRFFESV
jgi:hypothetical protein